MTTKPTLAQFWDKCEAFDWFYEMSDDGSVYRAGRRAQGEIEALAKASGPEYEAMWAAFGAHHYSGHAWGTEKQPKPERPL